MKINLLESNLNLNSCKFKDLEKISNMNDTSFSESLFLTFKKQINSIKKIDLVILRKEDLELILHEKLNDDDYKKKSFSFSKFQSFPANYLDSNQIIPIPKLKYADRTKPNKYLFVITKNFLNLLYEPNFTWEYKLDSTLISIDNKINMTDLEKKNIEKELLERYKLK